MTNGKKVIFFNFFGSALFIQSFHVPAKIKMFISTKVKRKIQITNLVIHQNWRNGKINKFRQMTS
jgi:hypothetical protein